MEKFIKIEGINHARIVGIALNDGNAYDFAPANVNGYRVPKNALEVGMCVMQAQKYYEDCVPAVCTGKFGVSSIYEVDVIYLAEQLAENCLNEEN